MHNLLELDLLITNLLHLVMACLNNWHCLSIEARQIVIKGEPFKLFFDLIHFSQWSLGLDIFEQACDVDRVVLELVSLLDEPIGYPSAELRLVFFKFDLRRFGIVDAFTLFCHKFDLIG